jgi:hypothetical protein
MAAAVVTVARQKATPNRLVFLLTSDGGEAAVNTIPNATLVSRTLGSGNTPGPLLSIEKATYATQAAARAVVGGGNVEAKINPRTLSGDWLVDANIDGSNLLTIEVTPPNDSAAVAILCIEHKHTAAR